MRHGGSKPKLSEFKINNASRSCPTKQPKYAQTGDWKDSLWGTGMKFPLMFWQHAYAELFSLLIRTCRFSSQKDASFCSRPPSSVHWPGSVSVTAVVAAALTDCCFFSILFDTFRANRLWKKNNNNKKKPNKKFHFKHKVFFNLSTRLCKRWQKNLWAENNLDLCEKNKVPHSVSFSYLWWGSFSCRGRNDKSHREQQNHCPPALAAGSPLQLSWSRT